MKCRMSLIGSLHEVVQTLVSNFLQHSLLFLIIAIGDHVDILGRSSLNDLILRVAGGKGEQIEENYVSNIREYAAKVKIYEENDYSSR